MILRSGITSFFLHREIPEFQFAEFAEIVSTSIKPMGFTFGETTERGITPNFNTIKVKRHRDEIMVIGHSNFPIIAFADPFELWLMKISFRNADRIATRIVELYPQVMIATQEELSTRIESAHLELLNRIELDQVKYWKPQTIGELVFNWWD
ncbi:MAG: hypothetical protein ACOVQH_10100 [Burkholderiaceae bacterium]|jgi:hypothetical protein